MVGYTRKRKFYDTEGRQEKAPFRKKAIKAVLEAPPIFFKLCAVSIFFY